MSAAAVVALGLAAQPTLVRAEAATFPLAFFQGQAPATALDLVTRTPGFALIEPDDDVRGYGGAQGNLLIDSARPTSKRESLSDLLKRIPAGSVERIELVQPGTPGIDMAG
ncbi:MAG: TonB-dependent receptor, partial [Brevundimonas sp.]